ncbi:putative quinol monooxygenase [Nocardiopsis tropica]|uniref:Antibiotic biosynthesis monooxygenase n=1 Tax=Nocardiopsis tropica TaxID=109330 RepID=A0ABU7KIQ0_9ACTN|nr:antibiotic biosynthesis monooxygenase [Nocardiopsis umidischolae]MEE2049179.1 antibiotic biosynthesis monooxygenase [Nocardiopsis umidischolae]
MSIQIVVIFDVLPERLGTAVSAFRELAARTIEEQGALRFDAFLSAEHADTVVLVEEWADQYAIDQHMKEACVREFLSQVEGCFRSDPTVHRLSPLSA